jgi:hypothetical protein
MQEISMNISPTDVEALVRGRRAFKSWRWQLWSQLLLGVVTFGVGVAAPLSASNSTGLCGIGFGFILSSSFQYLHRFQALLELAERAVNSSPQGIALQASSHSQHVP